MLGFGVEGGGCKKLRVEGLGCRVWGVRIWVEDLGFRV